MITQRPGWGVCQLDPSESTGRGPHSPQRPRTVQIFPDWLRRTWESLFPSQAAHPALAAWWQAGAGPWRSPEARECQHPAFRQPIQDNYSV